MPVSRLDQVYRSMVMSKFFSKGWGKPENLKRLFEFRKIMSKRDSCYELVPKDYPVNIVKKEEWSDCRLLEGQFYSPFAKHLPGLVPNEAETVYFQMLLPKKWRNDLKPVCVHLAGTGDHYFWRRRNLMAKPLLKEAGIGSIIVENPFYGLRKPKDQVRSNLHNVSDIFVMGGCLILESLVLFHWCEKLGFGPLGITGISMGGHMASLAATSWPKPLVLVPCLSWSTASGVFTQGVLSGAINWDMLMDQYYSNGKYREEIRKMLYFPEEGLKEKSLQPMFKISRSMMELRYRLPQVVLYQDVRWPFWKVEVFKAGQHFAQTFPESMDRIEELSSEVNLRTKSVNNGSGMTSHGLSVEGPASEAMLMGVGGSRFVEQGQARVVRETFGVKDEGYALKEQRVGVSSHRVLDEEANLMRAAGGGGGRTVASEDVQGEAAMGGEGMEPHREGGGSGEKVKRNVLDMLSPSKLISTKSILAGFHESKSNLLRRNGKSAAAQSPPAKDESERKEALQFMRGIMDECTHLKNFDVPMDPDLIIAVTAKDDGYVPQEGVTDLRDIWPGIEVRNLDAGHVSAYVLYQHTFREAIKDAFERAARKYYSIDNLKS